MSADKTVKELVEQFLDDARENGELDTGFVHRTLIDEGYEPRTVQRVVDTLAAGARKERIPTYR